MGKPDYDVWVKACKQKWKCKPDQFRSVFENQFVFAEDRLEQLAEHMHFAPTIERDPDIETEIDNFLFIPEEKQNNESRPRTEMEVVWEGMESLYAEKLTRKVYRRFKNAPTR